MNFLKFNQKTNLEIDKMMNSAQAEFGRGLALPTRPKGQSGLAGPWRGMLDASTDGHRARDTSGEWRDEVERSGR
jgi:hypothetical protein